MTFANRSQMMLAFLTLTFVAACSPQDPAEQLAAAQAALANGEPRTAEIHLKNLLQEDANNVAARALLGQVSLGNGDAAAAEYNFKAALELGADAAELEIQLLQSLLLQGKADEVLERLAADPKLVEQDRVRALMIEGAAHRMRGAPGEAETAYRAALATDPMSPEVRTELASLLLGAGRLPEARELIVQTLADGADFTPALLLRATLEASTADYVSAEATLERVVELERERRQGVMYAAALAQLVEAETNAGKLAEAAATADELLALHPQSPQAQFAKARVELEQGSLDAAEARLERLVAGTPRFWSAHVLLGAINSRQNQLGQAEMYLRQAVNGDPRDVRAQLMLADVYMRQQNVSGARDVLDRSAAAGSALFLALAGRASLEAGQAELAQQYFDRSEQSQPDTLRELVAVVNVYLGAGQLERAVRVLEAARFEGPDAERASSYLLALVQLRQGNVAAAGEAARRLGDDEPDFVNLQGTIALYGNDLDRARERFLRALALDSRYVPTLLNLATAANAANDKAEAAEYLRQVTEIEPNQLGAIFGLARLAAERGAFEEAEMWLARAPETALRFATAGRLHFAQKRFTEAAADFSRAFELQPSGALVVGLFEALRAAGDSKAESVLQDWFAQHPQDVAVNMALGQLALNARDLPAAAAHYETVLAVDGRNAIALNNLAWVYNERNDARAVELAERAREIAPRSAAVADTLGWIYVARGDAARGLPLLEEAARAAPNDADMRYHLAVALDESGNRSRATEMLRELVGGDEGFGGRPDAERRLARLEAQR